MNRQTNQAILDNFVDADRHLYSALASLLSAARKMDYDVLDVENANEHSDLIGLVRTAIRANATEMRQWKRELDTH